MTTVARNLYRQTQHKIGRHLSRTVAPEHIPGAVDGLCEHLVKTRDPKRLARATDADLERWSTKFARGVLASNPAAAAPAPEPPTSREMKQRNGVDW